eukprot:Transcript_16084.p2 GENE.Transcript_16084~~Transcript_16084.p2  ORF type:complete len:194 (+),score=27.61 Transcript_16084:326-907(+)
MSARAVAAAPRGRRHGRAGARGRGGVGHGGVCGGAVEEERDGLQIAVGAGEVQRLSAVPVGDVDARAVLEQLPCTAKLPRVDGAVQRRHPVPILPLNGELGGLQNHGAQQQPAQLGLLPMRSRLRDVAAPPLLLLPRPLPGLLQVGGGLLAPGGPLDARRGLAGGGAGARHGSDTRWVVVASLLRAALDEQWV